MDAVEVVQTPIRQRPLIVILLIVRFLLDRSREIGDRFVPLLESDVGKAAKFIRQ